MDKLLKKVKPQYKAAFLGTFIIGFLCHFYTMSHHFLTYDSMWNLYSDQDMISSGRQFLTYACGISSFYDLPALNGILAVFYLSLTAVLLVDIFKVRGNVTAVLLGGVLVTFPSVSSTFCYTYTIDGYMLAVLLTTLAFRLTDKYKLGFIPGILLSGIGIGIYQAYFAYLIVLCIIKILVDLLEEENIKSFFPKIGRYLCMGAGGYLFYVVSLKLMMVWKGAEFSGYQGTDKVLSFSLSQIPRGLSAALDSVYQFAVWGNIFTTTAPMKIAYVALGLLGIGLYLFLFIKKCRYRSAVRIFLGILLICVLPFGLNIISILSPEVVYHLLIRYAWVLLFVFVLILADHLDMVQAKEGFKTAAASLVAVFSIIMIFEFAVVANIVAFNMEERYEKTYALCIRIVDRLEQTEGYETGMEVAILGGFPDSEYYPSTSITGMDLSGYFGADGDYCVNATAKYAEFCAHYLNFTMTTISQEREIQLAGTEEFAEMGKFPDKESIRQIDGVWVIKING